MSEKWDNLTADQAWQKMADLMATGHSLTWYIDQAKETRKGYSDFPAGGKWYRISDQGHGKFSIRPL